MSDGTVERHRVVCRFGRRVPEWFAAQRLLDSEPDLAREARTTLAGSSTGVLLVAAGLVPDARAQLSVKVSEVAGDPVVQVDNIGLVEYLARRRWHAALFASSERAAGVGATFVGRLHPHAQPRIFRIVVERILVSCPRRGRPDLFSEGRELSLAQYAAAEPDLVAAYAHRICDHINAAHADRLRVTAASILRRPARSVIAAEIASLCCCQLHLHWVSEDGGDISKLDFPRPAETLEELNLYLQRSLNLDPFSRGEC